MIDSCIKKFIEKYNLQNKTIVVGFSGGYDSTCLLYSLNKLKKKLNLKLVGAHFNHNWRGETAKQEQKNCRKFCEKLEINFYTETAPFDTQKDETVAREQRYHFLENAMKKYNTDIVFTAHNYNDNAETLIYRIAKGTGLTGLKGISEKRENYYRPLLNIKRETIENYCKDNGLEPNNDLSNNDTVHKRNLIRHEILPLLEEINPNVIKAINNLSKVTEVELDILDNYLNFVKNKVYSDGKILTKEFKKLDKNLAQKIVYEYIYNSEIDYDYRLIENATNFLINAINLDKISKFSLTKDRWLYVDKNTIEYAEKLKLNYASFLNDCAETQKNTQSWTYCGIMAAVYVGLEFLFGLVIFLMTRGKRNPFRIYTFWETQKMAYWASVSPAILSLIVGFLLPQFAMMGFIFLFGLRIMWMSMRSLRPYEGK